MPYRLSWESVLDASSSLTAGFVVTVQLIVISIVLATILGLAGAAAARSTSRTWRWVAVGYVETMRNSPSLVKMYFIFFGLPELGLFPSPFWSGAVALGLHNGAYLSEVFRSAIASIPSGQWEAAQSLGLGRYRTYQTIIVPQVIERALPGIGVYWVELVKDTSITSALSVKELYFAAISQIALTQRTYEFFIVIGCVYLVLTLGISGMLKMVAHRFAPQGRARHG